MAESFTYVVEVLMTCSKMGFPPLVSKAHHYCDYYCCYYYYLQISTPDKWDRVPKEQLLYYSPLSCQGGKLLPVSGINTSYCSLVLFSMGKIAPRKSFDGRYAKHNSSLLKLGDSVGQEHFLFQTFLKQ